MIECARVALKKQRRQVCGVAPGMLHGVPDGGTFNVPALLQTRGIMKNKLMILLLLVAGTVMLSAGQGRALAAELIMFDSRGCPYCDRWKRDIGVIYSKTDEGRRAPLRIVNLHGKWPADLEGIQGIHYTPTFVLIDKGREVGRILGYGGEDFFWGLLGSLLKKLPETGTPDTAGGAGQALNTQKNNNLVRNNRDAS